jgi:hypothetical protein
VVMKARVARHRGTRFRSAPLPKHIAYLKREGENARMFDAATDTADERAFAERCEDDHHDLRFTVSPEEATQMDLHTFTRELMTNAEIDLAKKLDWIAFDHWNTDNADPCPGAQACRWPERPDHQPRLHRPWLAAPRGRAGDFGTWSSQHAGNAVGPGGEVEAERWAILDPSLREIADEGAGVVDGGSGVPAASAWPRGEPRTAGARRPD